MMYFPSSDSNDDWLASWEWNCHWNIPEVLCGRWWCSRVGTTLKKAQGLALENPWVITSHSIPYPSVRERHSDPNPKLKNHLSLGWMPLLSTTRHKVDLAFFVFSLILLFSDIRNECWLQDGLMALSSNAHVDHTSVFLFVLWGEYKEFCTKSPIHS